MNNFFESQIKLLNFPKIEDPRGKLTFIQNPDQIPFKIKRVFWTYDVPGGIQRGGHAFKLQQEVIIALSGSFEVILKDEFGNIKSFLLNRSYIGLYIPPLIWRSIENFSTNSVALHLTSTMFDKNDYIRDFDLFKKIRSEKF